MIKDKLRVIEAIVTDIRKHTDIAILGMSGGADSTLVAILCKIALGKEKVYGVTMAYGEEDEIHEQEVDETMRHLGINRYVIPIKGIVTHFEDALVENLNTSCLSITNSGNIRSRVRMTCLYSIAHHIAWPNKRVRVVGTGNLSEDFIGYDTKFGDSGCDFFPINTRKD